ncbi:hypothetical protein GCM10025870_19000 [Agromyces marinus]|uniref:Uncharacterized protein n=1 Tax=Agromyces marinus TaxID=1389020 RepID=A0ABM8H252_9MICO|nr:hypothetical protein GCM10025870_19000 [Agromyces marinus]
MLAVGMLVLPPAALSPALAADRVTDVAPALLAGDPADAVGADSSEFTVRDWASVVASGADPGALAPPEALIGFAMPSDELGEDGFVLTRFAITHCAIDAQPVGVEVSLSGWRSRLAEGSGSASRASSAHARSRAGPR